ncbi:MAG: hypothetical protein SGJ18_06805, partial [Pseudomonadota bacterium]|nr:hypothetical protein [Pseudomonadota bacterium]
AKGIRVVKNFGISESSRKPSTVGRHSTKPTPKKLKKTLLGPFKTSKRIKLDLKNQKYML